MVDLPRNNESSFTIIEPTPLRQMFISNVFVCALSEDYITNHYFILEQMMYEKIPRKLKAIIIWANPSDSRKHFNITILRETLFLICKPAVISCLQSQELRKIGQ